MDRAICTFPPIEKIREASIPSFARGVHARTTGCSKLMYAIAEGYPQRASIEPWLWPSLDGYYVAAIENIIATDPEEVRRRSAQAWTALHMACACAHADQADRFVRVVEILLGNGANVNAQDTLGRTPIISAVYRRSAAPVELVNLLISHRCDVNTKDVGGRTVLHLYLAIGGRDYRIIRLILGAGFKIDSTTPNGRTVMMELVTSHTSQMRIREDLEYHLRAMIDCGGDINAQCIEGNTVLHMAIECGSDVVKLLISLGANVNIQNNQGYTPIMLCSWDDYFHRKTICALKRAGATHNPQGSSCGLM